MAHQRKRHIETLIKKTLNFSTITGILGHRQVGKTTTAQIFADKYTTLDNAVDQALAQSNALSFVTQNIANPLVIDECQLSPALFPTLKEWVRIHKSPGQFLLTGSVRFSSRKVIRESLTGRIITWELLPMDWSEQYEQPLPDVIPRLINNLKAKLLLNPKFNEKSYYKAIEFGGLPGLFSIRDKAIRTQKFETQINTILERDLKLILQTTLSYSVLRKLLAALAAQFTQPLNLAKLQRETRISLPTLRKLLASFEALFMIRLVPSKGNYNTPIVYFEDIGELNHLLKYDLNHPQYFTAFLFHHLRVQLHYRSELGSNIFCYRNTKGDVVPICFQIGHKVLGIIPVLDGLDNALKTAQNFLKEHKTAAVLLVEKEKTIDQLIQSNIRRVYVGYLM